MQKDYFCKQSLFVLSAARGSAVLADEASLLVYERFLSAYGTNLTLGSGAVGYVFLQGSLHTVLPCVDALVVELQRCYKFYHVVDRHTIAQYARDELGVVPVFGVELLRESLDGGLVTTLVFKLEVVTLGSVCVDLLDDASLGDGLGQSYTLLVVLQTREYLVRIAVEQSDKCHPLLAVVLESHHVALQFARTCLRYGKHVGKSCHLVVGRLCGTQTSADIREIARFTIDGKRINQPQRGINIVKYSDGTVKKVIVK